MKSEAFKNLREFVEVNKRLVVAVVISICGLLALQSFVGQSNMECLGIADSKETMVAFETPVIVKRIFVLPGQAVKKGQPLVEVEPTEINLKLLEVSTELDALASEKKVRDSLMRSFGKSAGGANPMEQEIAGLQRQVDELKRQQSQAVRYAEEDGVVATVAFKPHEQVPPFMPIITLASNVPNMVYGFIHENRLSDFRVGDRVIVEPITNKGRMAIGKVVSLGNRITPFPERFQTGAQARPTYFGRELMISLPFENQMMMGEKVRVRAETNLQFSDLGFQAYADSEGKNLPSQTLAEGLELEASGMIFLNASKSLLIGSDDTGPNDSPFWLVPLDKADKPVNLSMTGVKEFDDLESMSVSGKNIFAMSSLGKNKKDKVKLERSLIVRFTVEGTVAKIDRAIDMRTPMLENLKQQPLLRGIVTQLDDFEIEGFSMDGSDAFFALKEPRLPDGTSVILKVRGLLAQIDSGKISRLDMDVFSMVKLQSRVCDEPAKITDLIKTKAGLLILSNCRKSEKTGQIWWLADNAPTQQIEMLTSLRNGRPEAMTLSPDMKSLYVGSDNGNKKGSDLIKVAIPPIQ